MIARLLIATLAGRRCGNDWGKVLKWHLEQDRLYAQQNPNAKYAEKARSIRRRE